MKTVPIHVLRVGDPVEPWSLYRRYVSEEEAARLVSEGRAIYPQKPSFEMYRPDYRPPMPSKREDGSALA